VYVGNLLDARILLNVEIISMWERKKKDHMP